MATRAFTPPPHVDPAIVRHCPLYDRVISYDHPHETIVPTLVAGPPIFYAENIALNQPGWVVTRAADIRRIYADTDNFTKKGNSGFSALIGESWDIIPSELDPPEHHAYRSTIQPYYSPSRMMALQPVVAERARDIIAGFRDRGHCEFIADFALLFPISIFLDLIGLPQDRMLQFVEWENGLIHGKTNDQRADSLRAIKALLFETIAERRRRPGEDLISHALEQEVDGRPWTDQELFGYAFNLYLGGLDTMTANLGFHFHHLATHPEDQARMRANDYTENVVAIEELLRAYALVTNYRICSREQEIDGHRILPGDMVAISTVLAGRDPAAYDDPQAIRLDRRPRHVSMGNGVHRCLGQHLARRELQTAIEEFLRQIPEFTLAPGFRPPFLLSGILHINELQLVW
jgi:cytochrome P450